MLLAASRSGRDPAELGYIAQGLRHPVPERRPYGRAVGIIVSILLVAWLIGRLNDLYVDHRTTGSDAPHWLAHARHRSCAIGAVVEAV